MSHSLASRLVLASTLFTGMLFVSPARAQEAADTLPVLKPIIIVNLANIEDGLADLSTMFEVAGRSDMMEVVNGLLDDKINSLVGIDRTRSIGYMVFLEERLPPRPRILAYIPVTDEEEFLSTVSSQTEQIRKLADGEYEVGPPKFGFKLRFRDEYAYIIPPELSGDSDFENRRITDAGVATAGLSSRYDVAVSVQLRNIPPLLREVFAGMFKAKAEAELQQRDDEPDAVYQFRKANGTSIMTLLSQVLRDGEQVTLGLDTAPDGSRSVLELHVDAVPETEFSKFLKNIAGKTTFFEPLLSDQAPLTISASWNMDEREKLAATGWVETLRTVLTKELPPGFQDSVERMATSLQSTVDLGHLDFIFQFVPYSNREFVLIGGFRMTGAGTFAAALEQVLTAISERRFIETIELNAHEHENARLHRLRTRRADDDAKRLFGTHPDVYLGVGGSVFWWGFGGEGVLPTMDTAIDAIQAATPASRTGTTAPLQIVFRTLPWLSLPERDGTPSEIRETANEAFQGNDDSVRIDVRPSETGGRIRWQFDGGFVRLVGLFIAQQYDRSQL